MDLIKKIKKYICKHPNRQFCLHNGFAGFSYGCPSNPVGIDSTRALTYLLKYYEITGKDPLDVMEANLYTLMFDGIAPELYMETGYRMLGFNTVDECLYGDSGLG